MTDLAVTMACGPYDRTAALADGSVRPEGIELTYIPIQSPPEIFARMIMKHSFDVAEMSCSMYMTLRTRGEFPFVALPIYPSRLFRHGFIFINSESGVRAPKDLEGKRVGVPEYRQTAAVWIRGILQHEYGVALDRIRWFVGGVNTPRSADQLDEILPEDRSLQLEQIPADRTLSDMLARGEIDAYIGARQPFSFNGQHSSLPPSLAPTPLRSLGEQLQVQRLFADYRAEERRFFQKTGIFPIMHTLVMKEELYQQHPWVAESLYKAWEESKRRALQNMRFSGTLRYMLPWLFADIEELDGIFGGDPFPSGLDAKANQVTVGTLQQYLIEQGFVKERLPLEELFAQIVLSNE